MRRAKIIATLGPASDSVENISSLIKAGMNVARVNMSHGTHDAHKKVIANVRAASKGMNQEVGILLDLQGPKIRVDKLDKELELRNGETWVIGESKEIKNYPQYKDCFIPTVYADLVEDCHDGAPILFDDGLLRAEAVERDGKVYKIKVLVGGMLKSNKGINLPDCEVSAPAFTSKDQKDLMFGLEQGIDFVALSFVRKKEDVLQVKTILHDLKLQIPIVAKIEKPQALDNFDEILEVTDAIMVARGDMGVEVGNHLVPSKQKWIITKCNDARIPVITATQMLESMTHNPTPTRAEASDVANAIWDGTDAVMLSGETSVGKYPVRTIEMMSKIIEEAERTPKERPLLRNMDLSSVNASLMVAASMVAEKVNAKYILSLTMSGHSCLKASLFRPKTRVLGLTNNINTVRRMCLYWGITPYHVFSSDDIDFNFQKDVIQKLKKDFDLKNGDKLVITRGDGKIFARGSSSSIKVEIIKGIPKVAGGGKFLQEASDDKKKILLDTNICGSCQNCVVICPHDIWKVSDEGNNRTVIDETRISACHMDNECVKACPTGAIEIHPLSY